MMLGWKCQAATHQPGQRRHGRSALKIIWQHWALERPRQCTEIVGSVSFWEIMERPGVKQKIMTMMECVKFLVHSFAPQNPKDEQWSRAMDYIGAVSELNYLSQIVVMLYEDPTKDPSSDNRWDDCHVYGLLS